MRKYAMVYNRETSDYRLVFQDESDYNYAQWYVDTTYPPFKHEEPLKRLVDALNEQEQRND